MPSSEDFHEIKISEIRIGERFRKDYGNVPKLAEAIKSRGVLLQPIILDRQNNLLAGGRRLKACTSLNWESIPCHFIDEVDNLTAREIELEENLHRKNLTWQESSLLTREIHKLYTQKYGEPTNKTTISTPNSPDPVRLTLATPASTQTGWSQSRTANALGVTRPLVTANLQMASALEIMPSLADETSLRNAQRKFSRLIEFAEREMELRHRKKEVFQIESNVLLGDATSLILQLETHSVDLIITDPPYGDDNLSFGQPHRTQKDYDDSPESTIALLRSIIPELRRVLKPSGHLYAFFGPKLWQQTIDLWKNGGFDVRGIICIWVKTGGSTGTVNWDFDFAPSWEPFVFAHNGERRLFRKRDSVFSYPPDRGSDRLHANQKPIALLEELIELSSDEGELVFDPFGGSGATVIAAAQKNRRYLTFEQSDVYYNIIKERLINLNAGAQNANDQFLPGDNETLDPSDLEENSSEIFNSSDT